jgi:hypothetical protein
MIARPPLTGDAGIAIVDCSDSLRSPPWTVAKGTTAMGALAIAGSLAASPLSAADAWLAPGDSSLRHDIELLADAEVIRSPITTWPISWPEVARAVMQVDVQDAQDPQIEAALVRVQGAARRASGAGFSGVSLTAAAARNPTALRTFEDTPREDGAVSLDASWLGSRFAMKLSATVVEDPRDDQTVRLDGSFLGVTVGNFMISAGSMDRWWGPGWEGSLILSANARPIPSIAIERNYSDPFSNVLLKWLGPWRATASLGRLEGSDVGRPDARFFGARASFKPRPWLEIGLSRTAQWCGKDRPCDWSTFGDLLAGRDNRGDSISAANEPGNQMAGYDFRMRSPWKPVPAALYGQLIGEDEAGGLPSRLLGLAGVETWGGFRLGSYRIHAEYADTACNFSRSDPLFNCAYRNDLYPQGYTYRGRAIGHALDGDGRMVSIGALIVRPHGDSWSLLARRSKLNRDQLEPEQAHSVSATRNALSDLELQYNRAFSRGALGVGLGFDDYSGPASYASDVRAFVQWRQGF